MKLSIVIVSYNVKHYLAQCLISVLRGIEGMEAEVVVVDNHSHDGTVEYLSERFPSVRFVSSAHNLGFARANNIAIRQTTGEYVLLLNPDTIVGEDVLSKCLAFMDAHPNGGTLGVKMLGTTGEAAMESRRGLPSPLVAFYKMTGLCGKFPKSHRFGHYYMSYLPWDEPARIEVVSGAFCLLRRKAIDEVGMLDEDFFMYGEDIDLSYRVLKGGYANYYLPENILHYKGESTHKSSFRYVHVFYEAMLIFFRKHYSGMSVLLSLPIKMAIYGKATLALFGMMCDKVRKSLGFFSPHRDSYPRFVFLGTTAMLDACKSISMRQGLDADYVEADVHFCPEGHHCDEIKQKIEAIGGKVIVVYDNRAYSYADMLSIFAQQPDKRITIGTFSQELGLVITGEEVIG